MVKLTIGGGNFKGAAFIGALEYLHKQNYLDYLDEFNGTSIGSYIGIMYIIGFEPYDILLELLNINLKELWDFNLNNLQSNYCLISNKIFNTFNEIIFKKENNINNITIKELYDKYSVNINIYSVSIKLRKIIIFNKDTYPDLLLITALKASCSIPLLFPPVKIDDDYFIDGCCKNITGCYYNDCGLHSGYIIRLSDEYNNIDTFSNYIFELLNCFLLNDEQIDSKNTIILSFKNSKYRNKINFNDIDKSDIVYLYYEGLTQAKLYFQSI